VIGRCAKLEVARVIADELAQGRSRPRLREVRPAAPRRP
jgi:hypothetical protein